jgi:hypothetical protein
MLEDPGVAEGDRDGYVNREDHEHYGRQRKVERVPIAEGALERMQQSQLLLHSALLLEVDRDLSPRALWNAGRGKLTDEAGALPSRRQAEDEGLADGAEKPRMPLALATIRSRPWDLTAIAGAFI